MRFGQGKSARWLQEGKIRSSWRDQERFSDVFYAPEHICDTESVPATMREL